MTAAPPLRDSVLDALGYASGVLSKPGFLWAPIVVTLLSNPNQPQLPPHRSRTG